MKRMGNKKGSTKRTRVPKKKSIYDAPKIEVLECVDLDEFFGPEDDQEEGEMFDDQLVPSPPAPGLAPIAPDMKPHAPVTAPRAPDMKPHAPVTAPRAPDMKPHAPVTAPRAPGLAPRAPGVAPLAPGVTPLAPGPAPLDPGPAPTAPVTSGPSNKKKKAQPQAVPLAEGPAPTAPVTSGPSNKKKKAQPQAVPLAEGPAPLAPVTSGPSNKKKKAQEAEPAPGELKALLKSRIRDLGNPFLLKVQKEVHFLQRKQLWQRNVMHAPLSSFFLAELLRDDSDD